MIELMRVLSGAALTAFFAFWVAKGQLDSFNPLNLRGLAPWAAGEISVQEHDGTLVAAFSATGGQHSAIYLRRLSADDEGWSKTVNVSPVDNQSDSQPSLWIAADGTYHCVWNTRLGRARYAVYYSRLEAGAERWSEPHRFSTGTGPVPPQLVGNAGTLFVYYWNNSFEDKTQRIYVFVSADAGKTWSESSPNYPAEKKRGRASEVRGDRLAEGGLALAWLDQTPGGVAAVFNRSSADGASWLETPTVVSRNTSFNSAGVHLLLWGKVVHVAWTAKLLSRQDVPSFQLWSAHSGDGGRSFSPGRLIYEGDDPDAEVELLGDSGGVGAVLSERFPSRIGQPPGGGRIIRVRFWNGKKYLESPEIDELTRSAEYFFSDLKVVAESGWRLVGASELHHFHPSRVLVLTATGEGDWAAARFAARDQRHDARGPVLFVTESDPVYTIFFHEVGRRQFLMEPVSLDTTILWGRFQFGSQTGL